MELLDARRLTGKNLVWAHPGATANLCLDEGEDAEAIAGAWRAIAREVLNAVGWTAERATTYQVMGGLCLAVSAPIDALYAAVDLIEHSVALLLERYAGTTLEEATEDAVARLRQVIEEERNPALLTLRDAAGARGVAFFSDDDEVSAGIGRGSHTWPVTDLPTEVPENTFDIPVGLVTGTNGKTTTVRLLTQMIRAAGLKAGLSSTDWIGVDDQIIDRGDYAGPGGARAIARQREVDIAVLETARGGLLRRGLGVQRADAALITNIGEDHLGDFGSRSVDELLAVKWVVTHALDAAGHAVLNADDARLVARAASHPPASPITWFTLFGDTPFIHMHLAAGGSAAYARNGKTLCFAEGEAESEIIDVDDVPITLGGAARHNVANALAAIAMGKALGLDTLAVESGLRHFTADHNPGRCNLFTVDDGVEVLLDFAHNVDAMQAIFDIAQARTAKRRALCFCQAGDRPDQDIRALAHAAWRIGLERVVVSELPDYRRGRAPGEVNQIISQALLDVGASTEQLAYHQTEVASLRDALAWAQPGDLVIMLGLGEQTALLEELRSRAAPGP
ncbi:MAG: Mur ligase family protein [Pseudomonadota bacterium]